MAARHIFVSAVVIAITACSSDSRQELVNEASRDVHPGMSLRDASRSLEGAGFDCSENYLSNFEAGDLLCSRTRSYYLVTSCVQRIFLTATPRRHGKVQTTV